MGASRRRSKGWRVWRARCITRMTPRALPGRRRPCGRSLVPPCPPRISRSISASSPRRAGGSPRRRFDAAWAAGQALSPAQAITLALGLNGSTAGAPPATPAATVVAPAAPTPAASTARDFGLTAREIEVLRLTTLGLTYAQIAERLSISPRTADAHLRAIYGKLGVTSRTAATRVALEQKLV